MPIGQNSVGDDRYPNAPTSIIERAAQTVARSSDKTALARVIESLLNHHDEALRLRAVTLATTRLLRYASDARIGATLAAILAFDETPAFQERAVRELLSEPNQAIAARLIEAFESATPRTASAIIEAVLAHASTSKQLLDAVREGSISSNVFSELQRHRLLNSANHELGRAAAELFAKRDLTWPEDDQFAAFRLALKSELDPTRGGALFTTLCAICHRFAGKGFEVGPSLDGEAGRPAESLLADVLDPSAEISAGYATYLVNTKSGVSHAGVLASESATSLSVKQAGGAEATVLRVDLESIEKLELSLMPTIAEAVTPADLADIIAYIKSRPVPESLVLFDDDPAFPGVLDQGRGAARLDWSDAASGRACITVEGFQRYTRQAPGWNFPIRENPKANQFRYLRLAMKSRGSQGIMIEFAADHSFPPDNQAIRTYYVGENSTGWTSKQLAKQAPRDWRSFTIDLWKGNGDFNLTGVALTVMGKSASYDRLELFRERPD